MKHYILKQDCVTGNWVVWDCIYERVHTVYWFQDEARRVVDELNAKWMGRVYCDNREI